jgi:hypothetical protein
MKANNTYLVYNNGVIHVIDHDAVATLDILHEHTKTGKRGEVVGV